MDVVIKSSTAIEPTSDVALHCELETGAGPRGPSELGICAVAMEFVFKSSTVVGPASDVVLRHISLSPWVWPSSLPRQLSQHQIWSCTVSGGLVRLAVLLRSSARVVASARLAQTGKKKLSVGVVRWIAQT